MKKYLVLALTLTMLAACGKKEQEQKPEAPKTEVHVKLIEYGGFFCGRCGNLQPQIFPALKKLYIDTKKLDYTFISIPTNQPAVKASQLLMCAKPENKDAMTADFYALGFKFDPKQPPEEIVKPVALKHGMTEAEVTTCLADKAVEDKVRASLQDYKKNNLKSIPTYIFNGVKADWIRTPADFKLALDHASYGQNPNEPYEKRVAGSLRIEPNDYVIGNKNAPNVIFEYISLSCPHCANFHAKVLPELKKQLLDTGRAVLVVRQYPLNAPALLAAKAASCVPKEQYFPLITTLFEKQSEWVNKDFEPKLKEIAATYGLDSAKFEECKNNKEVEKILLESVRNASVNLSVKGTPTFFVNGKKFDDAKDANSFLQVMKK